MARAHPILALRPFLPADTSILAEIFRASVEELTAEDYSEAQQAAWMSVADDEAAFGNRLTSQLTLVATLEASPVGFASLKGTDTIDMLYTHPAVIRQGIGMMLLDALERLATARGAKELVADVSDTASKYFEKRGYVPQRRNTISTGDEWLANTTMKKTLAPKGSAP
jgi:putative acetyltransferase